MKSQKIIYFILILLCVLLYANALKNDFIYDDIPNIIQNPLISKPAQFIFHLPMFVNSLIYQSAGEDPFLYRAGNVLMHGVNTVLVFMFLRLFFGLEASFLAAALFGVHPVHSEAVVWITAGNYLYWGLYILSIFLLYHKATEPVVTGKRLRVAIYLAGVLIFSYSLVYHYLSFSILTPFLLIFYDFVFRRWRKTWKYLLPFVACLVIRLILAKAIVAKRIADVVLETQGGEGPFIIDMVYSLAIHLKLLLWPARLTLFHDPVVTNPVFTQVGLVVLVGVAAWSVYLYKKAKEILFALGVYVLFLSPTFSPIPVVSTVGERYVYFSSIGLSIVAAYLYQRWGLRNAGNRKAALVLFAVVLIGFAVRTKVRNEDWKTDSLFWRRTLATSPDSPFAHNSMGVTYQREGRMDEAIAEYYKAIELKPNLLPAYNNLAIIYRTMDRKAEAINIYHKILDMNPAFLEMYNNLGALYSELGNYAEAEKYYKIAIERDPLYGYAYYNLGRLYEEMGRKKDAEEMIAKAFQVYPRLRYELSQSDPALMPVPRKEVVPAPAPVPVSVPVIEKKTKKKAKEKVSVQKQMPSAADQSPGAAHNSLGIKFIMNNQPQEAVKEFQKAVELDPENADAFNNLGNSLNAVGRSLEAVEAYNKAIDINPGSAVAHFNLCVSYFDARDFATAVQHCDLAAQFGYKVPRELLQQLKPYRSKPKKK